VVIEELTLTMPPARVEAFLARDAEVWTTFLADQAGFAGKEVWLPPDRPGTVVAIIRWETMDQWKAITPEQVAAVDTEMGGLVPDSLESRDYVVASAVAAT
jgi:uncharacterized protein (TIGR03792 family)